MVVDQPLTSRATILTSLDQLNGTQVESASRQGSLIGTRHRWTTPEMEARVVAAIGQRLAVSFAGCCPSAARPAVLERQRPGGSDPPGR